MPELQRKEVTLNGKKLSYFDEGPGEEEAVIFLHGWGDSKERYPRLIGKVDKRFRIIIPDMPGHGFSEKIDSTSLGDYVNLLGQFVRHLGLKTVNIAGFSMGGALSLMFTIQYPELVDKVVIWESSADFKGTKRMQPFRMTFKVLDKYPQIRGTVKKVITSRLVNKLITAIGGKGMGESIKKADEDVLIKLALETSQVDIQKDLKSVEKEVMLIAGRHFDVHVAKRKMKEMEKILPNGLFKEVPGAQHYARNRENVFDEIVEFFVK